LALCSLKQQEILYTYYEELNRDFRSLLCEEQVCDCTKHIINLPEAFGLIQKGYQLTGLGRFADALQCLLKAFCNSRRSRKTIKRNTGI
jgi:hypothetical protein